METPLQVFCCYARADQSYLLELRKRLIPLQREGLISIHTDIDISPGEEWEPKILHYLNTAHIILLLVSPDFIASEYCYRKEMVQALKRHDEKDALVIPIILRPVDLRQVPFSKIQSLPTDATPVVKWANQDDAFLDVTTGIEEAIKKLQTPPQVKVLPIEQDKPKSNFASKNPVQKQHIVNRSGWIWSWIKSLPMLKSNKRHCPRCYEEFFLGECDIVATIPPNTVGEVLYVARKNNLAAYLKPKPISGELLKRMAARACPKCGYLLPRNIDTVPLITIAIVGDVSSGKSHYIATLIKQLQNGRVASKYEYFRMVSITPTVEKRYIQEHWRHLFEEHKVLPGTRPLSSGELIDPLIYELTFRHAINKYKPRTVNIVIHDASGEEYSTPEKIMEFARHTIHASGLIYLIDPLSIPEVANRLPPSVQKTAKQWHNSSNIPKMVNHLLVLYDQLRFLRFQRFSQLKLSLPLAIAISKADLLKHWTPTDGNHYTGILPHEDNDGLNLSNLKQISEVVRRFFIDCHEVALLQTLFVYATHEFFAISATGNSPDQQGIFPTLEPHHCLDPLLWVFYELELICGE